MLSWNDIAKVKQITPVLKVVLNYNDEGKPYSVVLQRLINQDSSSERQSFTIKMDELYEVEQALTEVRMIIREQGGIVE